MTTVPSDGRKRAAHGLPAWLAETFEQRPHVLLAMLVGGQMLLWAGLPALFFHALPLDMVENVAWSRDLALGYYKHPPLQVWLTWAVLTLSGGATWSLYLLGPAAAALAFIAIFRLGSEIAEPRAGLLAALLFSLVFYANIAVPEFNANVVQMPIWAFAALMLWRALQQRLLRWWIALGVLIALGVYAKYSAFLLILATIVAGLVLPAGRRALRGPGPYVAAIVALVLALPNLAWLVGADFLPLRYAAERSDDLSWLGRLINPLDFLATQLADCAAAIVILLVGRVASRGAEDGVLLSATADGRRYALALAAAPLLLVMAIPILTGSGLRDMWGGPFILWLPLAALMLLRPAYLRSRLGSMLTIWLGLFVATPVVTALIALTGPAFLAKPQRMSMPAPELAAALSAEWRRITPARLGIVAGETWPSGIVSVYSPDAPSVFVGADPRLNPWISPERLAREGVLVVWPEASGEMPAAYRALGPFAAEGVVGAHVGRASGDMRLRFAARPPDAP